MRRANGSPDHVCVLWGRNKFHTYKMNRADGSEIHISYGGSFNCLPEITHTKRYRALNNAVYF